MINRAPLVVWVAVAFSLGLAFLPSSALAGTMYGCDVYNTVSRLYQVNTTNGALTLVGQLRNADNTVGIAFGASLAFDTAGTLWGVDGYTGQVGRINTATGQTTMLAVPSVDPGFIAGITFDPVTNKLYAVVESGTRGFYEVNQTTGQYTLLASTTLSLAGLTFGGDGDLYGVVYGTGQLYKIDPDNGFTTTALGSSGTLTGIRDLTVYGDGPGVSLFAKSDTYGLGTILVGPPNTSTAIGGLTGYGTIDGLAYSDLGPGFVVPEPSTLFLSTGMGATLLVLGWRRRKSAA